MPVTLHSRIPEIVIELQPRMSTAIKAGADLVSEAAKQRVPVRTGALQKAIHPRRNRQLEYSVDGGDKDAWYGHLVEHGTSKNAPHPFLVPALEENREEIVALGRAGLEHL